METLKNQASELSKKLSQAVKKLDIPAKRQEFDDLQAWMSAPDFWSDQKQAAQTSQVAAKLLARIEPWEAIETQLKDLSELIELGDDSMQNDLTAQLDILKDKYQSLQQELLFQGPFDDHDAVVNIYAGAGGTDAQDWAQMLERMYLRWAEKQGIKSKVVDESPGEEAGIKSATIELTSHSTSSGQGGSYLYGKLAGEHGVHRLVRRSPFNSAASRETSFAKVDVLPLINKPDEVQIDDKDLKIDVFRAGGHGGQSVNTTDSAVRVTHLPTGITVAIQNERSQLQNKETALSILRSRLVQLQMEQHTETLADIKGPSQSNEFGSQIRNYVLDDRILKDLRTGYENHDPQKTLEGDLDPLIDAWLGHKH